MEKENVQGSLFDFSSDFEEEEIFVPKAKKKKQEESLDSKIVKMYRLGAPKNSILQELNITGAYLYKVLRANKVPLRTNRKSRYIARIKTMTSDQRQAIINDYLSHVPVDVIQDKYGINKHALYVFLDEEGIDRKVNHNQTRGENGSKEDNSHTYNKTEEDSTHKPSLTEVLESAIASAEKSKNKPSMLRVPEYTLLFSKDTVDSWKFCPKCGKETLNVYYGDVHGHLECLNPQCDADNVGDFVLMEEYFSRNPISFLSKLVNEVESPNSTLSKEERSLAKFATLEVRYSSNPFHKQ